ncbi:MAG: hypothetical protein JXQ87_18515 [Bacteroidia bacterium]
MKKALFLLLAFSFAANVYAQRKPMEPSLIVGYQRFMKGTSNITDSLGNEVTINVASAGFFNIGYSGFFELESNYAFTRRARFNASALLNPVRSQYGLQVGGSYSYVLAGGFKANIIREFPLVERTWMVNLTPQIGLDIWFMSFMMGYNLQLELSPFNAPPPPPLGRLTYELNIYWPLKRNKRMYR